MATGKPRTRKGENPSQDESKASVHSVRMTDETYDGINSVKQALGATSLEDTLKAMVDSYSMSAAKELLPTRSTEITEFEVLSRKLIDAYTHSLILCQDAEERAFDRVNRVLESKELTIVHLQKALLDTQNEQAKREKELCDENRSLKAELRQVKAERDALETELETIKKAEHTDAAISSRFDTLQKTLEAMLAERKL